ncbi:MAG: transglutaminase domain-containing protein, partial [Chloroflexi bacterium]|nr:transglutaminase domain-containing protein [Chloroflexota bacterium]
RAFDTFDGEGWALDVTSWYLQTAGRSTFIFGAPQPRELRNRPRYLQIYFLKGAAAGGSLYSGYAPLTAAIPNSEGVPHTGDGAIYRVMSALPDFTIEGLGQADPRSRLEFRYHYVPEALPDLEGMASQIVSDATSDLERARRIVTFMDRNYSYDEGAADQFGISRPPMEFLTKGGAGTSMDFATATVLLARSVGIPSRLVTGYLPGSFEPLSGTYVVRTGDQHAWAELFFDGIGWVPFDSAPLPAAAAFGEGGASGNPDRIGAIFDADYGNEIYQSIRSSPELITDSLAQALQSGVLGLIAPLLTAISLAIGLFVAWRYRFNLGYHRSSLEYAGLAGEGRDEMLRVYRSVERLLRRAGFTGRGQSQTLGEYTASASSRLGDASEDLEWIRDAAQSAAYDPSPFDRTLAAEARMRLERLRIVLKSHCPRTA